MNSSIYGATNITAMIMTTVWKAQIKQIWNINPNKQYKNNESAEL